MGAELPPGGPSPYRPPAREGAPLPVLWPIAPLRLQLCGAMLSVVALGCLLLAVAMLRPGLRLPPQSPHHILPLLGLQLLWLFLGGGLLAGQTWAWGLGRHAPLLCLAALAAMPFWGPAVNLPIGVRVALVLFFSPAALALPIQVAIDARRCPPGSTHTTGLRWTWVWLHLPLALSCVPGTYFYVLACS